MIKKRYSPRKDASLPVPASIKMPVVEEAVYVRFAEKEGYFMAMRYPALSWGGARFHVHAEDGKEIDLKEVSNVFGVKFNKPSKEGVNLSEYGALSFVPYTYLSRVEVALHLELVTKPFEIFLDYMVEKGVTVNKETAMSVFTDSLVERLEEDGVYPPKEGMVSKYDSVTAFDVGGIVIRNNKIVNTKGEI